MEIISPPAFRTETVTDWDFLLTAGIKSIVIKADDTVNETETCFIFETVSPKETIVIYKQHLNGYSRRTREMKYAIPGPPTQGGGVSGAVSLGLAGRAH